MATAERTATACVGAHGVQARWGTRIEPGWIDGHPCLQYADRPRALSELLLDAQRWSSREFIVQGARRFTGERHALAVAHVAAALQRRGVRRGQRVMMLGFNHIEWLVAFWALQCLGATVVLGNAWWSDEETAHAIRVAQPSLVLTDREGERALPFETPCCRFADLRQAIESDEALALQIEPVDEEDVALVLFSSGTTDQAKGVAMTHRCVIANIQNLMRLTGRLPSELPDKHPGTVSLVSMPLFHLAGIQVSFMTMLSGGKLVFLEGRFDALQALELIHRERVRTWGAVPTMVSRVVQHERFGEFDTSSVSSVQMGGAAIPPDLRMEVQRCFPATKKRVGSMYGLTEAGGVLAAGSGEDIEGRSGCVGRPLPCVEIRIDKPDAEGVGEIAARTPTATSGYLGDTTPISDWDGWVFSGDLGRLDEDGRLYVVGRSKDMIIRGGENISSLHVENCLRTHPAVLDAAVVPLPHADLGEEVGAAVVCRPGETTSIDDLRAHALKHLARFQVPSRWWLTEKPLPTNASGKVVKREVLARWPHSI
ncbi:MAG: long-chain fatty acid--CoA ligase [Ideonella sp.]|nr:long-chain fatty acid--CoA ligase [Ideonella sp.]